MPTFARILFLLFCSAATAIGIVSVPSLWPNADIGTVLVPGPAPSVKVATLDIMPPEALPENMAKEQKPETVSPEIAQSEQVSPAQSLAVTKVVMVPPTETNTEESAEFSYPDHANDVPARSIHLVSPPVNADFDADCGLMCLTLIAANDLEWVRITHSDGRVIVIAATKEACDMPLCLAPLADDGAPADRTLEFAPVPQDGPGWGRLDPKLALRIYDRHGPYSADAPVQPDAESSLLARRLSAAGLAYLE